MWNDKYYNIHTIRHLIFLNTKFTLHVAINHKITQMFIIKKTTVESYKMCIWRIKLYVNVNLKK